MSRRLLLLAWVAFLVRGNWYCVQQPAWEGFDEWAHYAAIRHVAENGSMPRRSDRIAPEIEASLRLLPLSQSAADALPGVALTHDEWWRLPEAERARRERAWRALPRGQWPPATLAQYEGQQPPLYYFAMALPYRAVAGWSMPSQVLALRLISVLIASVLVFVAYAAGREVLPGERLPLLTAFLIASMPGLFINVCRVGNECLSAVLVGCTVLATLRALRRGLWLDWALAGLAAGAAMLTKGYCLAFLPLLPLAAVLRVWRERTASPVLRAGAALCIPLLLAGWWYWGNLQQTGTLSGEQLDIAAARLGPPAKLEAAKRVDWRNVLDTGSFSHIWIGGWSFLVTRRWMYRVFQGIALVAAAGVCVRLWRGPRGGPAVLCAAWAAMAFGVAWFALVAWQIQGTSNGLGWYLYGAIVSEVVLITLGLTAVFGRRWSAAALALTCTMALALDAYTCNFILMPYHSGLISHSGGRLATYYPADGSLPRIFAALAVNDAPVMNAAAVAVCWTAYLLFSVVLAGTVWWIALRDGRSVSGLTSRGTWALNG